MNSDSGRSGRRQSVLSVRNDLECGCCFIFGNDSSVDDGVGRRPTSVPTLQRRLPHSTCANPAPATATARSCKPKRSRSCVIASAPTFCYTTKTAPAKKMHKKWKWNGRTVGVKLLGESGKATAAVVAKKKAGPIGQPMRKSQTRLLHSAH